MSCKRISQDRYLLTPYPKAKDGQAKIYYSDNPKRSLVPYWVHDSNSPANAYGASAEYVLAKFRINANDLAWLRGEELWDD